MNLRPPMRVSTDKTTMPDILLSAMCVTTYLKAMPTDENLLSVSSRASNSSLRTKVHLGKSSATSPAHRWVALNHLLHRLDMVCFLALGATSYLTQCENLRSDTIPDFQVGLCCVRVCLVLKESVDAPICPLP